ncbi:MAG: hypothetical protein F6J97_02505 [Leptolyngbya sp. SIO4C1]|nr:hypothetical protein [Leptolyngbya sp. SIO4C1]
MFNFAHWFTPALSASSRSVPAYISERFDHRAVIEDVLEQGHEWRVRYQASFWRARSTQPDAEFLPEDKVYVVGRENLVLLIQRRS